MSKSRGKRLHLAGQTFGRLTILCSVGSNYAGSLVWFCACSCRKRFTFVTSSNLRQGKTRSCGCLRRENTANKKHGYSKSLAYMCYMSAKSRCRNPRNKDYAAYGGRGIKFLFTSVQQWIGELGPEPGPGFTIDRINNDGDYAPGNIRWADRHIQRINQRPKATRTVLKIEPIPVPNEREIPSWMVPTSIRDRIIFMTPEELSAL